jgi:hypothetical protein
VLRLFVRRSFFDEDQAEGMLQWPHSGFHVHAGVGVSEDDRPVARRFARYCAPNPCPPTRCAGVTRQSFCRHHGIHARGGVYEKLGCVNGVPEMPTACVPSPYAAGANCRGPLPAAPRTMSVWWNVGRHLETACVGVYYSRRLVPTSRASGAEWCRVVRSQREPRTFLLSAGRGFDANPGH